MMPLAISIDLSDTQRNAIQRRFEVVFKGDWDAACDQLSAEFKVRPETARLIAWRGRNPTQLEIEGNYILEYR